MSWDFSPVWANRYAFIAGLGVTILLALISCLTGTLLGLAYAVTVTKNRGAMSWALTGFGELIRSCPPLVLLLWAYYLLPATTGISASPFWTSVGVLTLTFAVFAGDVFRGALQSVPHGTRDAAIALGMKHSTLLRRVYLPEMMRRSFPALNGLFVSTLKLSSICSTIACAEATYRAMLVVADRPRPFEIYSALAAAYMLLILPIVFLLRRLEASSLFALEPATR